MMAHRGSHILVASAAPVPFALPSQPRRCESIREIVVHGPRPLVAASERRAATACGRRVGVVEVLVVDVARIDGLGYLGFTGPGTGRLAAVPVARCNSPRGFALAECVKDHQ